MAKKQFKAESKRLLDMMINSIYTHKEIFLREIISNSSDALDKLCYKSLTEDGVSVSREDLFIKVTIDKENRIIKVSDNGIGMTAEELEKNLGTIARSGSLHFKNDMEKKEDIDIIGQFGVGFYSAFMVADKVTVITKAYGEDVANCWESDGADGYTIMQTAKEGTGTDIYMKLKDDSEDERYSDYLETYMLRGLIKKYSDYIRYPIKMDIEKSRKIEKPDSENPEYEKYIEEETVNSMIPIWQRSKDEVTEEELNRFYKDKYFDTKDPALTIRADVEGNFSYKALLYVPSSTPMGYYTKEYKKGLELYSSGVMIMDSCEDIIPEHFRFVKGVVDSQDLSLNISREMLQHDRQLGAIRNNIEKKIKQELKKLLTNDPENYEKFWQSFGLQLKYGIVSDYGAHRELLKDLLLYYTSGEKKLVTLERYVETMPEEQKFIYYACGETVNKIDNLPQTEPLKDKGYSILYMTDEVDEFVINMLGEIDGKQFKSVNDKDLGIESEEEKNDTQMKQEENQVMLDYLRDSLDGKVTAVRLSGKLKSHPVCLTTDGEVSLEMEKYFATIPGDHPDIKAQRVLEINPAHKAFYMLQDMWQLDKDKCAKLGKLLYSQALLIADISLENPAEYTDLFWELI
ncbi:MAG: molecular chaperone HtpG [Clostridia bacterium]|nr:molecular chaperone HtpG [Clostridia bacterium]MBQ6937225.1 molecular chaperone HtpG [Clostridia bacterium]